MSVLLATEQLPPASCEPPLVFSTHSSLNRAREAALAPHRLAASVKALESRRGAADRGKALFARGAPHGRASACMDASRAPSRLLHVIFTQHDHPIVWTSCGGRARVLEHTTSLQLLSSCTLRWRMCRGVEDADPTRNGAEMIARLHVVHCCCLLHAENSSAIVESNECF